MGITAKQRERLGVESSTHHLKMGSVVRAFRKRGDTERLGGRDLHQWGHLNS